MVSIYCFQYHFTIFYILLQCSRKFLPFIIMSSFPIPDYSRTLARSTIKNTLLIVKRVFLDIYT